MRGNSRDQFEDSIFKYKKVITYFMTIFFTFFLMVVLLLVIGLSREVLSDKNFEEYVLQTQSLLNELEEVENNPFQAYENYSTNFSNYKSKSLVSRLGIDDYSFLRSQNANFSFLTLRVEQDVMQFGDNSFVILGIEPEIEDDILVIINNVETKVKLIDITDENFLIVLQPYPLSDMGEFIQVEYQNYMGVFLD